MDEFFEEAYGNEWCAQALKFRLLREKGARGHKMRELYQTGAGHTTTMLLARMIHNKIMFGSMRDVELFDLWSRLDREGREDFIEWLRLF